jgi:hypothetical protein
MKNWICRDNTCGHLVVADEKPNAMKWTDGHVCYFVEERKYCPVCKKPYSDVGVNADGTQRFVHINTKKASLPLTYCNEGDNDE